MSHAAKKGWLASLIRNQPPTGRSGFVSVPVPCFISMVNFFVLDIVHMLCLMVNDWRTKAHGCSFSALNPLLWNSLPTTIG
jgi:hypothetical protein